MTLARKPGMIPNPALGRESVSARGDSLLPSEQPTPGLVPEAVGSSQEFSFLGLIDVLQERASQDARWGVSRNLHPQLWVPVLVEEVGEVAQAVLKGEIRNYRHELVQVAAVALAAIQDFDWQERWRGVLEPPRVVSYGWERAQTDDWADDAER